jgi:ribosomal-protein-alanine acetyltransferase
VNIRPASTADIPAILAIERACDTAAHWSEAEYPRMFGPGALPRVVLVAEDGTVFGFLVASSVGSEWEIENVAVAWDRRGRGIGLQLVEALLRRALAAGAEQIHLEVRATNRPARSLYERAGFHESGRRPGYYKGPGDDAVLYRWLPPAPLEVQK